MSVYVGRRLDWLDVSRSSQGYTRARREALVFLLSKGQGRSNAVG
jgi:hypothetical protein